MLRFLFRKHTIILKVSWLYLLVDLSFSLLCLISQMGCLRPLTSTGCCFWISSWWGGFLLAHSWCHKVAFSAPKHDGKHTLVNVLISGTTFHLDILYISLSELRFDQTLPAGFQLQGWGPGRHRRTGPEAPQTSLSTGPVRCRTESSLVEIWVLWRKEKESEFSFSHSCVWKLWANSESAWRL